MTYTRVNTVDVSILNKSLLCVTLPSTLLIKTVNAKIFEDDLMLLILLSNDYNNRHGVHKMCTINY